MPSLSLLLTRPQERAGATASLLEARGHRVFIEPLLRMEPLAAPLPMIEPESVLALTSRLAVAALEGRREEIAPLLTRPCYCVGAQTAAAARAFGFQEVRESEGGGAALARMILDQTTRAGVLHLAGRDRASGFQSVLTAAGRRVALGTVYEAVAATALSPDLEDLLRQGRLEAALFFSARTAQTFASLTLRSGLASCCKGLSAIGLSRSVLEAAGALPWGRLCAADRPTEEALLACLDRLSSALEGS